MEGKKAFEEYKAFLKIRFKELGLEGYSFYKLPLPPNAFCFRKRFIFTTGLLKLFEDRKDKKELVLATALHEAGHRDNSKYFYLYSFLYASLFCAIPTSIVLLVTPLGLSLYLFFACGLVLMHGTAWARRNMKTISNKLPPRPPSVFWKYEYQADDFAKRLGYGNALADVLIILGKNDEIDEPFNIQKLTNWLGLLFYYLVLKPVDNSLNRHPPFEKRVARLRKKNSETPS